MVDDAAVRVSDAERERVAARLSDALGEGRLAPGEFDERVRAAYGAVVRGDLPPLTADLPDPQEAVAVGGGDAAARSGRRPRRHVPEASRPLAAAVAVWAVVSALNLGLWVIVALTATGPVHPWWIWVAGPWGVVLALHALAARAGLPRALPPVLPGALPVGGPAGMPCSGRRR